MIVPHSRVDWSAPRLHVQLLEDPPQREQVCAVEIEKLRGRGEELVHDFRLRPRTFRGEDDEFDAAVVRDPTALRESQLLEAIHDPGRVGGVTLPGLGKLTHRAWLF